MMFTTRTRPTSNRTSTPSGAADPTFEPADVPVSDTPAGRVIDALWLLPAGRAFVVSLQNLWENSVRPAVRALESLKRRIESEIAEWNQQAEVERLAIEVRRQSATESYNKLVVDQTARDDAFKAQRRTDREAVTSAFAAAGLVYDGSDQAEQLLLAVETQPREVIAAELELPLPSGDRAQILARYFSWFSTVAIGLVMGTSIGIMTGVVEPDALADSPAMLAVAALIGMAIAATGKAAMTRCHANHSETAVRTGRPALHLFVFAVIVDLAFLGVDSMVESYGLLRFSDAQSLLGELGGAAGAGPHPVVFYAAAALITMGYIVSSAFDGYYSGRARAVEERLTFPAYQRETLAKAERKKEPEVRSALKALADARCHDAEYRQFQAECSTTKAEHAAAMARLDTAYSAFLQELEAAQAWLQGRRP